jgi:hypothetical protein
MDGHIHLYNPEDERGAYTMLRINSRSRCPNDTSVIDCPRLDHTFHIAATTLLDRRWDHNIPSDEQDARI